MIGLIGESIKLDTISSIKVGSDFYTFIVFNCMNIDILVIKRCWLRLWSDKKVTEMDSGLKRRRDFYNYSHHVLKS